MPLDYRPVIVPERDDRALRTTLDGRKYQLRLPATIDRELPSVIPYADPDSEDVLRQVLNVINSCLPSWMKPEWSRLYLREHMKWGKEPPRAWIGDEFFTWHGTIGVTLYSNRKHERTSQTCGAFSDDRGIGRGLYCACPDLLFDDIDDPERPIPCPSCGARSIWS